MPIPLLEQVYKKVEMASSSDESVEMVSSSAQMVGPLVRNDPQGHPLGFFWRVFCSWPPSLFGA